MVEHLVMKKRKHAVFFLMLEIRSFLQRKLQHYVALATVVMAPAYQTKNKDFLTIEKIILV